MKRVFYVFAIFIFISFIVIGSILNYLAHSYMEQATEVEVKRDLKILATITKGALASNDYERVEEQVFLWGELEPHVVSFEVIIDGDIDLIKFAREIQTSNILHLTHTVSLPSGRIITFSIEYDLSDQDKEAAIISAVFLSMSCCIAAVFIFLLWRILQNLAFIPLNREIAERKRAEEEVLAKGEQLRASNQQLISSEQQLRASNQQLLASEQQLKASNQQLLSSEQQLKASNQQLLANEQEREKLLNTLEAKNEELQGIVFIATHDLKSPLVNINGFSAILNQNCKDVTDILKGLDLDDEVMQRIQPLTEEDIPQSLKFIAAGAAKMKMLLDGLLRVSRVGTVEIDIIPLNMNKMMQSITDTFAFQINEADVEVTVADLPACLGDAEQINQVFSNIIDNALKYLDPERKGFIKISGKTHEKESICCIEDNGIGIHSDHQSKAFQLFHRLNPDDATDGQGIGLTITKRALNRNSGWTWVESEPGKGSKFFVSLPTA